MTQQTKPNFLGYLNSEYIVNVLQNWAQYVAIIVYVQKI